MDAKMRAGVAVPFNSRTPTTLEEIFSWKYNFYLVNGQRIDKEMVQLVLLV